MTASRRALLGAAFLVLFSTAAPGVSFQEERQLGLRFDLAARQQLPLINDPEVVGYVDAIGQRIVAGLDGSFFDYQFLVVRDPNVNAFAVPGGYIYVHSGLITDADSADEIAAVLGHEVAHVHAHHLARQQEATRFMNYASLLGVLLSVIQPAVGALATAASASATLQYRREFEQEADYLGVRYLRSTPYDARAMLDFFKKLGEEARAQPNDAPPYLLSHPLTDERLNHLEAVLRTQQWAPRERPVAALGLRRAQVFARVRTQRPADVLQFYRKALDEAPGDAKARFLFGLACLETGQLEAAKTALGEARDAGVVEAERELGRLALRQRQPEAARDLLRRAAERDPKDAGAYAELAGALEALGDTKGAMAAYRHAVEAAPGLESARYGLGVLAGRAGDQAEGYYQVATAARLGGDYEKAVVQYSKAAELLPAGDPRVEEAGSWVKELSEFAHISPPKAGAGN
jgi:predicted Zn-dependent protease